MIRAFLIGEEAAIAKLTSMPDPILARVRAAVERLSIKLQRLVIADKLSGQVLHVRTGTLRRSITERVTQAGGSVTGIVGTNVKYAHIQEYGGKTSPHVIEAKRAKALAFPGSGPGAKDGLIFRRSVNHPGSRMPERSFLRASLRDMRDEIKQEITNAAQQGARGHLAK